MRIDAHHHFWRLDRGDYGWLTPQLAPIYRDFGPADFAALMEAANIERTILVQAAPSEAETKWLLDLASRTPFVAGVVGWVDFDAANVAARVDAVACAQKLVGLRPMMQDMLDDTWMLGTRATVAARAMTEANLRFDALVKPRHLAHLRRFVKRHPDLRVVIDHGAKPDIANGQLASWAEHMRAIAAEGDVYCKLSGLMTEAGPDNREASIAPFIEVLLDAFGSDRLMWGSDWPVLNLAGTYDGWLKMCARVTSQLSADDAEALWGASAARFYGITA